MVGEYRYEKKSNTLFSQKKLYIWATADFWTKIFAISQNKKSFFK